MKLTKLSKGIIDLECEKIELIIEYINSRGYDENFAAMTAFAIYSKRHDDIGIIDEDDD